jgi:hypothetical protein
MLRKLITGAAFSTMIVISAPSGALAQPPTPPEIVHRVDRGIHRATTDLDDRLRHHRRRRVVRHTVYRTTYHRVRALCNDGRFHIGRTGYGACAGHGGLR